MIDGKRTLSSEQHTLYIETINEQKKLIDKEKNIYEITPKYKRYRVYIGRFFELRKGLHTLFNSLKEASDRDYLELIISSGGGFVHEGQQFYNLIQDKFYGKTLAYLDNHGYSMGALLFCMADKRVIYEYSELMFHNYSAGAYGKGGDLKARIEHYSKTMDSFFHDIIVKKNFLTEDEFKEMLVGQDYWMEAKELCKRGIATHVIYEGQEVTAKEYLKVLKKRKKEKKKRKK
ncbi:ATP-dependent Clp protease proteolytic subunit [hydrothermal vent metagenome]|uniref:ATP-dependent Clp protease proteolytic subunit n=1 Tax=hydrothermal vent metagenome TaxID=652676 RepID=A0A1W1CPK0_9ZZZZ